MRHASNGGSVDLRVKARWVDEGMYPSAPGTPTAGRMTLRVTMGRGATWAPPDADHCLEGGPDNLVRVRVEAVDCTVQGD